jgi:DNA uptake protein ComE-like DNA-binding protein
LLLNGSADQHDRPVSQAAEANLDAFLPVEHVHARGIVLLLLPVWTASVLGALQTEELPASLPDAPPRAVIQSRVDPNRAPWYELALLPRIGETMAKRIVTYREASSTPPAFRHLADLENVHGIGPKTVSQIHPHLSLPVDNTNHPTP